MGTDGGSTGVTQCLDERAHGGALKMPPTAHGTAAGQPHEQLLAPALAFPRLAVGQRHQLRHKPISLADAGERRVAGRGEHAGQRWSRPQEEHPPAKGLALEAQRRQIIQPPGETGHLGRTQFQQQRLRQRHRLRSTVAVTGD